MKNDSNKGAVSHPNAWIAVDHGLGTDRGLAPYTLVLKGDRSLYQAIAEDDWVLVLNPAGEIVRTGRVLRLRFDLEATMIFFDRLSATDVPLPVVSVSLTAPSSGSVGRIEWGVRCGFVHGGTSDRRRRAADRGSGLRSRTVAAGSGGRSARPGGRPA